MSDHLYTLLAIHLLFSIIIIVTHTISQQNKTLHSCDRIALTVDTQRNKMVSVNY